MSTIATTPTAPDLDAVKAKQRNAWSSGDYAVVGTTLQIVGEQLCETIDLCSGATVLDVAAGNGNATLAAARRYTNVTSTDYVEALLERSHARAQAEGLPVTYRVASIETHEKAFTFRYRSFDHFLDVFRTYYGPMHKAFLALGDKGDALEADLRELQALFNTAGPDGFVVPSSYVEVVIHK